MYTLLGLFLLVFVVVAGGICYLIWPKVTKAVVSAEVLYAENIGKELGQVAPRAQAETLAELTAKGAITGSHSSLVP